MNAGLVALEKRIDICRNELKFNRQIRDSIKREHDYYQPELAKLTPFKRAVLREKFELLKELCTTIINQEVSLTKLICEKVEKY